MIAKYGPFEFALAERYRFEEELGRGAMGIVYRAHDVRLGRQVAIKILHPMLTNELGVARFQSEIRIAASLRHPNIVAVHESGEIEGQLFYAMDYLGGETLRARLNREKQLSVKNALRITENVASALQYAHDHGVVHRDVKPENILLFEDRACVVDFGLARVFSDVDAQRLTASGLAVGTPHYLSPEQASAEREIGPGADQYALACVLYEMLVGEPPFTGPTASAIAMRHITEAAPPMRTRREATSVSIELAVRRAMEKVPADRWESVEEFLIACQSSTATSSGAHRPLDVKATGDRRAKAIATGGLGIGALLVTVLILFTVFSDSSMSTRLRAMVAAPLDTNRIAVFAPSYSNGVPAIPALYDRLSGAISRWKGLEVPSTLELNEAAGRPNVSPASPGEASSSARRLKAGRFLLTGIATNGRQIQITADLYDASGESGHRRVVQLVSSSDSSLDAALDHLVFSLLFGSEANARFESAAGGTRNTTAMNAYLRARTAMSRWNLPVADSALTNALRNDPEFAQASLALGTVRFWARDATPEVARLATAALDQASRLSASDLVRARALRDLGLEAYGSACLRYDTLLKRDSLDFEALYGTAECNRKDNAVVASVSSSAKPSYRASRYRAMTSIERAFDLLPDVDACCIRRAVEVQRRNFPYTSSTLVRRGRGIGSDSTIYAAYPEWIADTLAFTPVDAKLLTRAPPPTHTVAVEQARAALLRLARKRTASTPNSVPAMELLGEAMELAGDKAAVDTIRKARRLATSSSDALRLAVNEVWLRLKVAIPGDQREMVATRVLAESLLANARVKTARDAKALASIAALVGDGHRAAALSEQLDDGDLQPGVPNDVLSAARALLVYAAVGGSADTLHELEARLSNGIRNGVLPGQQRSITTMLLGQSAALAYPNYTASGFNALDTTSRLIRAEKAHAVSDPRNVRRLLDESSRARVHLRPRDLTLDTMFPESWLLASIGDNAAAEQRIGQCLDAIPQMTSAQFGDPVTAGSLLQAMTLRARALQATGQHSQALRWARAVTTLTDTSIAATRRVRASALTLVH